MHCQADLESEVNIESEAAHRWHHEVVYSLIVVVGRSHRFRVERSLIVDHPQVAPYERELDITHTLQTTGGECAAYGHLTPTVVSGVVDVLLWNRHAFGNG